MIFVVGTGPAGLTAAFLLAKKRHQVTLIEPTATPGGLWAGWMDKGLQFERGMHTYVECGVAEIDTFFMRLPVQSHDLSEEHSDRGGVYWNGKLNTGSPYIDLATKTTEWRELLQQILTAGALDEPFGDRALDRAMALWGPQTTLNHIMPILAKLYGTSTLAARALDLTNLTRVCILDADRLAPLMCVDRFRTRIGWPNRDTLPIAYQSKRRAIYPVDGMQALVKAALNALEVMGVKVHIGDPMESRDIHNFSTGGNHLVWAAPLRAFCRSTNRNFPTLAARRLTVVNFKGTVKSGGVHYFHCYEPNLKTFRVTSYDNFTFQPKTSVELLDVPAEDAAGVATSELRAMLGSHNAEVVGIHDMGPVLTVPSPLNDDTIRACTPKVDGVTFVGQAARPGLFFQPDVLRNVHTTVNCLTFTEGQHG